jgi:hypothetical protein
VFVTTVNAWMNTPVGFTLDGAGRLASIEALGWFGVAEMVVFLAVLITHPPDELGVARCVPFTAFRVRHLIEQCSGYLFIAADSQHLSVCGIERQHLPIHGDDRNSNG